MNWLFKHQVEAYLGQLRHIWDGLKPGHGLPGGPCGWPGQGCGAVGAVAQPLEPQLKSSCYSPGWAMAKHSQWDGGSLSCSNSELGLSPEYSPPALATVTKPDIPIAILVLLFPDWDLLPPGFQVVL